MERNKPRRGPAFLIVKISAMGDIIHTFPVARAIKQKFPGATIDWVAGDGYIELVRLSPDVDGVIPFHRGDLARWWRPDTAKQAFEFVRRLKKKRYDAVLDLQGLLRSGIVTSLARAPVKSGFGYAREGAALFYNRKITSPGRDAHAMERYMGILASIGVSAVTQMDYGIKIPADALSWAAEAAPDGPYIVINPNARWVTKRWPLERFGALAREMERREGTRPVIIGGPGDEKRGRAVMEAAGPAAIDLTGKTGYSRLAAILKNAKAVFTNDSGPMHLAAAVGAPVVALFGPTNPDRTGPYGPLAASVRAGSPCSPCYKRRCLHAMECMTGIETASVLAAWERLKSRSAQNPDPPEPVTSGSGHAPQKARRLGF